MSSPKANKEASSPKQKKAEMNGRTRTTSGTESLTSQTSPQTPLARLDSIGSTGSKPYRQRVDSGGASSVRSPVVSRLQRQISRDSAKGVIFSRSDSVSSRHRRPSLSLGHADSIPFHLEKPPPEEVDPTQAGKSGEPGLCGENCEYSGKQFGTGWDAE